MNSLSPLEQVPLDLDEAQGQEWRESLSAVAASPLDEQPADPGDPPVPAPGATALRPVGIANLFRQVGLHAPFGPSHRPGDAKDDAPAIVEAALP